MYDDPQVADLKFMQDPDRWPWWPKLPLKRYIAASRMETGILYERGFSGTFAFEKGGNLFEDRKIKPENLRTFTRAELHILVDEGWEVD